MPQDFIIGFLSVNGCQTPSKHAVHYNNFLSSSTSGKAFLNRSGISDTV